MKFFITILCIFVAFGLYCYGFSHGRQLLKREAISLGHAQYNPTNANFEWKAVK